MLVRGNTMTPWLVKPDGAATWSAADWGRAATLESRWKMLGLREDERRRLIPCAVWRSKLPGLVFDGDVMKRLAELDSERLVAN
jgi:hypothetical protein